MRCTANSVLRTTPGRPRWTAASRTDLVALAPGSPWSPGCGGHVKQTGRGSMSVRRSWVWPGPPDAIVTGLRISKLRHDQPLLTHVEMSQVHRQFAGRRPVTLPRIGRQIGGVELYTQDHLSTVRRHRPMEGGRWPLGVREDRLVFKSICFAAA